MAKLSRRDILTYLLLAGGIAATADPRIVQGILDSLAPEKSAITAGPAVLSAGNEPQVTSNATSAATMQSTEQNTESAATNTPLSDLPTMAPG